VNLNLPKLCRRQLNIKVSWHYSLPSAACYHRLQAVRRATRNTNIACRRGNIIQRVTASGTLSAVVSVDVGSQVSGKISALICGLNSPVKKASSSRRLTRQFIKPSCNRHKGDLASAQADVPLKGQNLERKKILVPLKAASQLDLDQATADLRRRKPRSPSNKPRSKALRPISAIVKINAPVNGMSFSRDVDWARP